MKKRSHNRHIHGVAVGGMEEQRLTAEVTTQERNSVLRALGSVIYAVRLPDNVVKIGHTGNLASRSQRLGTNELLAFRPGTYADEQQIHRGLTDHRHHGREYYHPTPEVLALVNGMRDELGLDAITG